MSTAEATCPPEEMDSEDPLFVIYTSGTSEQSKGVVHTQAGYLLYAAVTHQVHQMKFVSIYRLIEAPVSVNLHMDVISFKVDAVCYIKTYFQQTSTSWLSFVMHMEDG